MQNVFLKLFSATILAGMVNTSVAAVNFPFPQNSTYGGNGITVTDKVAAAASLKSGFQYYLSTFYNESGSYAGIRSNAGSSEYFSEGVGYGMLLMVYFSDNTTSYQSQFDKLWAFYKASEDSLGLMNWKIGNVDPATAWGKGAATDAEMDVAAALIQASKQFGNAAYLTEAATLLRKVRLYEFEANGLHKPGDSWNDKKNPSYVAPGYYELFKNVDTEGAAFWGTALNANLTLLETNSAEYSTGLFDNWASSNGKGLDGYYGYDAARAPWRLAQAYYWFGNSRANTMLTKLGSWVAGKSASAVSGSIQRSGTFGGDHNSTFVATLMTSLVTNSANQAKLNEFWNAAVGLGDENYFNESMKLLSGLTVTGNMPDFSATTTPVLPGIGAVEPAFLWNGEQIVLGNLSSEPLQVELLNLNGQLIRSLYNGKASGTITLTLSHQSPGICLVKVLQGERCFVKKIVIL